MNTAGWLLDARLVGPLLAHLRRDDVSEVMINGPGPVYVDVGGRIEATTTVLDRAAIDHLVERLVSPLGRRVDRSSPMVDARLPDGSRVHVVVPPLAIDGPYVTIRRFRRQAFDLTDFATPPVAALLVELVGQRCNIVVSGATSSGKTALLNALAGHVSSAERVVTIEDAAELQLGSGHVVRLESRPASVDGPPPVTTRDLVRAALRMRPDRIVVGEVRGAEALDMVQAMNTGHPGSLSTCHADGPDDALSRLEVMIMTAELGLPLGAVRAMVQGAVDVVVQVRRGADGDRRITAVAECMRGPVIGSRPLATGARVVAEPSRGRWSAADREQAA